MESPEDKARRFDREADELERELAYIFEPSAEADGKRRAIARLRWLARQLRKGKHGSHG
jgi:hypothetical protein